MFTALELWRVDAQCCSFLEISSKIPRAFMQTTRFAVRYSVPVGLRSRRLSLSVPLTRCTCQTPDTRRRCSRPTEGQSFVPCKRRQPCVTVHASTLESCQELQDENTKTKLLAALANSNDLLPYAVVASTLLALVQPVSFQWFTPPMYAPAMGFLMFAVGVNLQLQSFATVFETPKVLALGCIGQWLVKPALGVTLASTLVPALDLPAQVATGLILYSCVSGAQLSNYATFLVHPEQAALSIVLTALSTAAGVVLTPLLVWLLLGQLIPVDVLGMAPAIMQIVIVPVALGLMCSTFFPGFVKKLRPLLTPLSLLDTCACVGASLSSNADAARSTMGATVLLPVLIFHFLAFIIGYFMTRASTSGADAIPVARCLSLETGMQSGVLALLLESKFFGDPLISLPCGISMIVMTLSGFGLVVIWKRQATKVT